MDKKRVWVLTNDDAPDASLRDATVRAQARGRKEQRAGCVVAAADPLLSLPSPLPSQDAWAGGIEVLVLPMLKVRPPG